MTYEMFPEEKLSHAGQKKNNISKLSIKMFPKRKTRAGKVCVYRILLSFKTSVTYKKILASCRTTVSVVKQLSSDITQFFAGHFPMSGANIQA